MESYPLTPVTCHDSEGTPTSAHPNWYILLAHLAARNAHSGRQTADQQHLR